MKHTKILFEIVLYVVFGLLLGMLFFRQIVFSDFDLLLGDVGDARFNGVILEHWWQVLQGNFRWLSPGFFFPVQGVLGYSDAGFLNAIPYVILRFMGLEPFTSCQIVLFALVAIGWIGTIIFFRVCLHLSVLPAITGAILFVFPNSMAVASLSHTQLFTVCYIPYLATGIWLFIKNFKKKTSTGIFAGIFTAILVPAIFYTGYYTGWFSVFFILLWSAVVAAWGILQSGRKTAWQFFSSKRSIWLKIWPYGVLCLVCFIPFLLTYIPSFLQFRRWPYHGVDAMLPSFIDYVNVGPNNWIWSKALFAAYPGIAQRPMAHELTKGVPVCLFLAFLFLMVCFLRKTKHHQLKLSQNGTCKILTGGREINENEQLTLLAASLSMAVMFAWLLMLKIYGLSLWLPVLKLIPGAGSIRAVFRFQHILAFPIAVVIAIGVHQFINYAASQVHSTVKRGFYVAAVSVFCLILVVEEFNTASLANHSKKQQHAMLAGITSPPEQARVFALLPAEGLKKLPYEAQIDAMIISQKFGLPTINGYSGIFPPYWGGIYDFDKPEYVGSLKSWIHRYSLRNDQLYFLDLKTGSWTAWEFANI